MKERPIIFSGESVRAILDGRKSQTRRVIKPQPICIGTSNLDRFELYNDNVWWPTSPSGKVGIFRPAEVKCLYGAIGDKLWVRETWRINHEPDFDLDLDYKADNGKYRHGGAVNFQKPRLLWSLHGKDKWRSPIFMPKWAARIWLEITNVRVERVQNISHNDWVKDFCPTTFEQEKALQTFVGNTNKKKMAQEFWDSLNAKRGFGWSKNPFVWVIEFEVKK